MCRLLGCIRAALHCALELLQSGAISLLPAIASNILLLPLHTNDLLVPSPDIVAGGDLLPEPCSFGLREQCQGLTGLPARAVRPTRCT